MREAEVKEKVFVITGCASGIGLHLADALVRRGAHVVATDIAIEVLRSRAAERRWSSATTELLPLDVRDPGAWQQVLDRAEIRFGVVDVLINVAGFVRPAWIVDCRVDDVDRHLDVNARGVLLGTRAAARRMVARGSGHVVNICSLAGIAPTPGIALYSASKFAIRGFSLAAAQELRPRGVHVSVVCPDGVDTPMAALELRHREAALVFSGRRLLSVDEVTKAVIGRVLRRRPLEVCLPAARGWLCRLAGILPWLAYVTGPFLARRGDRRRERLLQQRATA